MKHWYMNIDETFTSYTWISNTTSITDETLIYMNIKHYNEHQTYTGETLSVWYMNIKVSHYNIDNMKINVSQWYTCSDIEIHEYTNVSLQVILVVKHWYHEYQTLQV